MYSPIATCKRTTSNPVLICARCTAALPITLSIASTNCCHGTSSQGAEPSCQIQRSSAGRVSIQDRTLTRHHPRRPHPTPQRLS
jgi:hypothetical protein